MLGNKPTVGLTNKELHNGNFALLYWQLALEAYAGAGAPLIILKKKSHLPSCFSPRESGKAVQFGEKNKQTGYPQECECYFSPIRNICVCGLRSQRVVCATLNIWQVASLLKHIQ